MTDVEDRPDLIGRTAAGAAPVPLRYRTGPRTRVAVLAIAGMTCAMMQTLVTPLFPILPQLLDTSTTTVTWVITATLLAAAVSTPIAGRLGDMYGKKRVMLGILAVMLTGSLVAGFAPTIEVLIVGRALQGVGLALISLGMSTLREILPRDRVPGGLALMSSTLGIGGALGLPLGGFAVEHLNWHSAFWLSAILSILVCIAVALLIPAGPAYPARLDPIGAVGLALGTLGLLLALSKGSAWGWASATTLSLAIGGAVVLVAWAWFEWRRTEPLIDLRTTVRRSAALTHLAAIAGGYVLYTPMILMPILLQMPPHDGVGFGRTALAAALLSMPGGLLMMVTSPIGGRVTRRYGGRTSLIIGSIVNGVALALIIVNLEHLWAVVVLGALLGLGTGFTYAALPTLIMDAVPESETGAANGFNTLMRYIGTALASTLAMTILAAHTVPGLPDVMTIDGFVIALSAAAVSAICILVLALLLPGRSRMGRTSSSAR